MENFRVFHGEKGEPFSLYVHIPFCAARCRYCDFASNVAGRAAMERYTDCLLRELEAWQEPLAGRPLATVFFGGGTPGLLPVELLERITDGIRSTFSAAEDGEWTLESNPEVTTREKARAWRMMGFDRLSLGLQAVQPELLRLLGRRATAEDFRRAVEAAREAGFTNLNADLMASLPGQRERDLLESIDRAVDAGVQHISLYSLVVHEETPLGADILAGRCTQPDEDRDRDMFAAACAHLAGSGFARYEISNFARPGYESRHNLVYWRRGAYLGLGTAAASCDGQRRFTNIAGLEAYCQRIERGEDPGEEQETLTALDTIFETAMLGLRLTEGILLPPLRAALGALAPACDALFARWEEAGLATVTGDRLALTARGLDVQNALLVELMECLGL